MWVDNLVEFTASFTMWGANYIDIQVRILLSLVKLWCCSPNECYAIVCDINFATYLPTVAAYHQIIYSENYQKHINIKGFVVVTGGHKNTFGYEPLFVAKQTRNPSNGKHFSHFG